MEPTITDSQKIQVILEELGISSYRLTQELNVSSGALYHIISGKNKLSINIVDKICKLYPKVNKKYLLKGIGEPIIETNISADSDYVLIKKQDFEQVKLDIENLYKLLEKLTKK